MHTEVTPAANICRAYMKTTHEKADTIIGTVNGSNGS